MLYYSRNTYPNIYVLLLESVLIAVVLLNVIAKDIFKWKVWKLFQEIGHELRQKKLHRFWLGLLAYGSGYSAAAWYFALRAESRWVLWDCFREWRRLPIILTDQAIMNYREPTRQSKRQKKLILWSCVCYILSEFKPFLSAGWMWRVIWAGGGLRRSRLAAGGKP